jgi:peptidoglycan/LPS O-acetylase OafA/YrhL
MAELDLRRVAWLPSLTSLRALAALAVFVFHLQMFGVVELPGADLGSLGVTFFFALSGFVLAWGSGPTLDRVGFLVNRVARIYPAHLAALLLVVPGKLAVGSEALGPEIVVPNLLLLQGWVPDPLVAFGLNGVSWSLSCEMFFYLAFPIVVPLVARWTTLARVGAALAVLAAPVGVALSRPAWDAYLYYLPVARLGEFLLGVALGLAVREAAVTVAALRAGLVVTVTVFGTALAAGATSGVLRAAAAPLFVLVICAFARRDVAGRRSVLACRPLQYLGEISYGFYLVHQTVIVTLVRLEVPAVPALVAATVGSVLLAVALYHGVERPCRRAIIGWWRRREVRRRPGRLGARRRAPSPPRPTPDAGTAPAVR